MGENGAAVMESVTQSGLVGMQMGLAGMQQQHIMAAMLAAQVPGVSNSSGLGGVAPMPGMQVAGRKQRELYVGNLTPGICTPDLVKQFFTQILTTTSHGITHVTYLFSRAFDTPQRPAQLW